MNRFPRTPRLSFEVPISIDSKTLPTLEITVYEIA
jgi:hypothetical protein